MTTEPAPRRPIKLTGRTLAERVAAVAPYAGHRCRVTYRMGSYAGYDQTATGTVIGASFHATNGNSTGDLIIAGPWTIDGLSFPVLSVALAHIGDIEVVITPARREATS